MKDIQFSYANAVSADAVAAYEQEVAKCQEMLEKGTGAGNDFLGWLNLPSEIKSQ